LAHGGGDVQLPIKHGFGRCLQFAFFDRNQNDGQRSDNTDLCERFEQNDTRVGYELYANCFLSVALYRKLTMGAITKFLRQDHAGATIEFVALMPLFLFLTFFVIEISIAVLSVGSAEKAVQAGARLALVSDPVVLTNSVCTAATSLRLINCPLNANTNAPGSPCTSGGCENFATVTCAGGSGG